MRFRHHLITMSALMGLLSGCVAQAPVPDPPMAERIGDGFGYQAIDTGRSPGQEPALPKKYVVLAFSGGGTRAAALSQGVLRELGATRSPVAPDLTLLDAVDMVSSTSGGSVAAANFVLQGPKGYQNLDGPDGFLLHNGMLDLIGGVLDPFDIAERAVTSKSRVQLLSALFRRTVFGDATFDTLRMQRPRHPPLLILNSADMATGERFPFVQRQLDRLCLDLRDIALADAVTASAAFPIALTPLRLPNRSPCPAQSSGQGARIVDGYLHESGPNRRELAAGCREGRPVLDTSQSVFLARGRRQFPLFNLDPCGQPLPANDPANVRFVHLLDGGIADNLGLAEPLETLTSPGDDQHVTKALANGTINEVVVIAVNARSQPSTSIGRDTATPGIAAMAGAVISAAIDGRSTGLNAELATLPELLREKIRGMPGPNPRLPVTLPEVTVIPVDFELIQDPVCRTRFQEIGTNWNLTPAQVVALEEIASAILRASPKYLKLTSLSDTPEAAQTGQIRAARACRRVSPSPTSPEPPVEFGPP